jgi:threonine/homoserine/homoserine lactone efflux protein
MKSTAEKIIIGLGVWLVILPFTGFPRSWKTVLMIASGLVIVYLGARLWRTAHVRTINKKDEVYADTFTETV